MLLELENLHHLFDKLGLTIIISRFQERRLSVFQEISLHIYFSFSPNEFAVH